MIQQGDMIENKRTGQRMIFLKIWAETNGPQLRIDCFSPVTKAKDPEHIHPYRENRFKIISGELYFYVNGKEKRAVAGKIVLIPKNVPYYFLNRGPAVAHYIQKFLPPLKMDGLFETFFALACEGKVNSKDAPNIFRISLIMLAHEIPSNGRTPSPNNHWGYHVTIINQPLRP